MRQKGHPRSIWSIFVGGEVATEQRRYAGCRKKIDFPAGAYVPFWFLIGQVTIGQAGQRSHTRKWRLTLTPFHVIGAQQEFLLCDGCSHPNGDKPFILGIGQTAKQNTINHAEDRGTYTSPQRHGQNRGKGKTVVAAQSTHRVAKIIGQDFQEERGWHGGSLLTWRPKFTRDTATSFYVPKAAIRAYSVARLFINS